MTVPEIISVPISRVYLHEELQNSRLENVKAEIKKAMTLVNVPVGMRMGRDDYLLLDGAHRLGAIRELGYDRMPLQVMSNPPELSFWSHLVANSDWISTLNQNTDIALTHESKGAIARIQAESFHAFVCPSDLSSSVMRKVDVLRSLSRLYETAERIPYWNDVSFITGAQSMVSFVETLTLADLAEIALSGRLLPSGVTRIICRGRVLNLNIPLDLCRNEFVYQCDRFIQGRLQNLRFYEESVFVCESAVL